MNSQIHIMVLRMVMRKICRVLNLPDDDGGGGGEKRGDKTGGKGQIFPHLQCIHVV